MDRRLLTAALCFGLVALVVLLYVQTARHVFTVCDDNAYIYENSHITSGLTWDNVKWAFRDAHAGNWHPLTWMSHMLDWQWFGRDTWEPENQRYRHSWEGGHHLVSMGIHCISVVLLFLALRVMTGTLWPSFVVAALFAVHPLRAESVAWAAERKDVLCGLFWMATLLTYAFYAHRRSLLHSTPGESAGTVLLYLLLIAFMGLGLMAKSMMVTMPCVLILLDIWPLSRWRHVLRHRGSEQPDLFGGTMLIVEKFPLFLMAALDSRATVAGQDKGVALNTFEGLPLSARLLNAVESWGEYLRQTFWPNDLAPFYAHPHVIYSTNPWPTEFWVKFWIYSLLLTAITLVALWLFIRRPYLAVGWFWYLGVSIPVIGILQVGTQARADRYTYLPMIGVYVMLAWLLKEVADRWPRIRPALAAGGLVVLTALSVATFHQVSLWVNSLTLFKHALHITEDDWFGYTKDGKVDLEKAKTAAKTETNFFAFNHIGIQYDKDGKEYSRTDPIAAQEAFDRSAAAFAATLAIKPDYDFGNNNLGVYFARPGKSYDAQTAEKYFRQAIGCNNRYADAYNNLGIVLADQGIEFRRQGKYAEAVAKLEDAARQHDAGLRSRGDESASDHNNLSRVYLQMGQAHKAAAEQAQATGNTAKAAEESKRQGQAFDKAMEQDEIALQCDYNSVGAWQSRAEIFDVLHKPEEAVPCFERIIAIDPMTDGAARALSALVGYYMGQKPPNKAKAEESLDKAGDRFLQEASQKSLSVEFLRMPSYLVNAYLNLKIDDKARQWLDRESDYFSRLFKPDSPDGVQSRISIAVLYLKLNQPDKAVQWLNSVLDYNNALLDAYAVRTIAYEKLGNQPAAKADFERILRASLPERFRMAQSFVAIEQPDKAMALLNQMLGSISASDAPHVYSVRGDACMCKGDFAAAKADYERVFQMAPDFPGVKDKLKMADAELAKKPKP